MMKKEKITRIVSLFLLIAMIGSLAACGSKNAQDALSSEPVSNADAGSTTSADTTPAPTESGELTITDMAGDSITLPGRADTVACTWPSGTQLLITLGISDVLVAVPADSKEQPWATYMAPEILDLPDCGNDESAESLLNLGADILLTTESDVARELRTKGIMAITVNYYSVEEMRQAIQLLGSILPSEYETQCSAYLDYLDDQIERVESVLAGTVTERKTLYYINGNNNKGLYKTAGADTMNEAWANYAYTDFVTSPLLASNETNVDAEAVLATDPEYIVIGGRYQDVLRNELLSTSEWSNIRAVANGNVLTAPLGISPFDRFGAEFAMMIPWLANQVYPDLFEYDSVTEIKNFYKAFSRYDMTEQEAEYIVQGLMPDGTREIGSN